MNSSNSLSAPVSQETSEDSDKMNCELCVAEFDSDAELKKHKELHKRPSDKSLNCLDCGISFENQKSRSDHIYTLHPGYLPAECNICGRRFKNGTVLKGHKNTHLGKTNFQCETCGFKFLTKGNYERHLKTHERGKLGKEQKCLYCEELFEEIELLRVHVLSLHKDQLIETPDTRYLTNTAKISFKCTTCEYIGNSLPQTIKHFEMHTGERESEHLCKYCNVGLPTVDKKRAHEKKHLDLEGNVHFNCHECPATFETAEAFVEHYNTHYDQLAHRCRYCARMFTRLAALARHMEQYHQDQQPTDSNDGLTVTERIHIDCYGYKSQLVPGPERNKFGNLAFLCKICGRKFFGFDGLAKHYRDHETNGKFNCPICEMGYPYNFELHKHLVKHHDNKSMKSYECCLCQESIEGALNFKKHCTDHSQFDKEKCTYICLECDSEFTTYLKMSQHLKTHKDGDEVAVKSEQNTDEPDVTLMEVESSGTKNEVKCEELPYACKFCSKRFVHAGFLAKHVYEFHADLISNPSNDGLTLKERIYLDCFEVLAQITPGPERNDAGEVGLSCKYCGKVLFGYTAILIHQRVHEKNAEFNCEICDKQFQQKSNYKRHMAVHEKTKVKEQQNCLYCAETFSDIFGLRQHIWSSHAEVLVKLPCTSSKFYKCKTCSYLGSSLPDIIKHYKLHTGDGLIQHECKHCKVGFTTKQETKLHEAKHIDSDGNVHFDCQSCPEKLKTAEAFAKHFQMHYDQMPFSCKYCPRKFELAGVWARHVEHYHKDMIPADRNDGLTTSERIHVDCYNFNLVPGPERDSTGRLAILCRICEVKCYGFINILKHSRQHESAEKFLCPICDQKSSYEYELRTHLEKHDKKSAKKMYECSLCKEKVKGAIHFHQHCISHKEFDKSDGSYNCSRCGFTSPSFVKFGNHLNETVKSLQKLTTMMLEKIVLLLHSVLHYKELLATLRARLQRCTMTTYRTCVDTAIEDLTSRDFWAAIY